MRHFSSDNGYSKGPLLKWKKWISEKAGNSLVQIICLFLSGLSLRLYTFQHTHVINQDGALYINQARALFAGNWELAKSCGFQFISLYHLLIPVSYKFFGDWIVAAKAISVLFGTCATIIFYLLLKQFFRSSTAFLGSLAFSLNPFFVRYSASVVKDPVSWFFALLGLLLFVSAYNSKSKDYFLMLGSLSFLVAALARVEILIYYIGAVIWLLMGEKKLKRLFIFNSPLVILFVIFLSGFLPYQGNLTLWQHYLAPRINHFILVFSAGINNADYLQKSIEGLTIVFSDVFKALYMPFLPLLIAGFWYAGKDKKHKNIFRFFMLLIGVSGLALLLFHFKTGILSWRYTALIVLPAYLFIGFGLEKVSGFLMDRGIGAQSASLFACLLIVALTLPSGLKHRRVDKIIYKDIGTYIAAQESNQKTIVMAPDIRIMFYANVNSKAVICANPWHLYDKLTEMNYEEMFHLLKEMRVQYFVWDEKSWNSAGYDFPKTASSLHFQEIMDWDLEHNHFAAFKVL